MFFTSKSIQNINSDFENFSPSHNTSLRIQGIRDNGNCKNLCTRFNRVVNSLVQLETSCRRFGVRLVTEEWGIVPGSVPVSGPWFIFAIHFRFLKVLDKMKNLARNVGFGLISANSSAGSCRLSLPKDVKNNQNTFLLSVIVIMLPLPD